MDDRLSSTDLPGIPAVLNGGGININGYHTLLAEGSRLDVSGGLLIGATGRLTYGSGGGIVVKGGQDPGYASVNGGTLNLGATMTGYSGGKGGTLSVTAPAVQVGGTAPAGVLKLDPSFFTQGGFTSYVFTGTGMSTGTAGQYIPGVTIAPGTRINPVAENLMAVLNGTQGGVNLTRILQPEGVRSPVNISFSAPGVSNSFVPGSAPIVRGDLVMGAGSSIVTDAKASVSLSGQTVDLLGSITAPGGSISVSGSSNTQSLFVGSIVPVTTVHVGPESVLSTAGKVVLTPDPRGNRTGSVLPGGTVSLSGNIAAEAGSVIDVSGTSGELDVAPGYLGSSYLDNNTLAGSDVVRTRIDSNAGSITLNGGQQLFVDSTLRGAAGGAGALGGSLRVSSGRFLNQETFNVLSPTLRVTQGGFSLPAGEGGIRETVTAANGTPLQGMGYFTADQVQQQRARQPHSLGFRAVRWECFSFGLPESDRGDQRRAPGQWQRYPQRSGGGPGAGLRGSATSGGVAFLRSLCGHIFPAGHGYGKSHGERGSHRCGESLAPGHRYREPERGERGHPGERNLRSCRTAHHAGWPDLSHHGRCLYHRRLRLSKRWCCPAGHGDH